MDPNQPRFGSMPPAGPARGHRRAFSETFLHLPDVLLLDSDPDFSISDIDFPSLSDENPSAGPVQSDRPVEPTAGGSHGRSLSVDGAFFEGLGSAPSGSGGPRHRRRGSMDGFEGDSATSGFTKKAMDADKLAELSLHDPKRARRILANRQSAARSKERKVRYTNELERKVHSLQSEATTLSAQLAVIQRDTASLCAENRELQLRVQAMEQEAHLSEALNDTLQEEIHRLKFAVADFPTISGNAINSGLAPFASPFYYRPPQVPNSSFHQAQAQAQQRHAPRPQTPSNGQSHGDRVPNDSMDLM